VSSSSASKDALRAALSAAAPLRSVGRVVAVTGLAIRCTMPGARVGDVVRVRRRGEPLSCEVVGFDRGEALAMPLGTLAGVGIDDEVEGTGTTFRVHASEALLGRVVDGLGHPIDGLGTFAEGSLVPVDREPEAALQRKPVQRVFGTGLRAIDALFTLGEGQRVGLFSGPGVGKSSLLGAMARHSAADVVVVALVGERGREVGEFVERVLGPDRRYRDRTVIVAATSDCPALERVRAAQVATAYAEYFRDQGKSVLLLVDSVTRVARAQREVGLAAGEPPTRRGFPPSVFAMLPRLLERSGQGARGAITAVYTVLVEGGDMDEPVADEVRGILDGHIVLDRTLATRGIHPAIDLTSSLSRLMHVLVSAEHRRAAAHVRAMASRFEAKRDLISLGAYQKGSDAQLDEAIARMPAIEAFLTQLPEHYVAFDAAVKALKELAEGRR